MDYLPESANKQKCNCTYEPCNRKENCYQCITYHKQSQELPACYFSPAIETTYDRSIKNFISCSNKGDSIEGTWILQSDEFKAIKMIYHNHFMYTGYFRNEQGIWSSFCGTGIYILQGKEYTETCLYHSDVTIMGKTGVFEVWAEKDILYQKGPIKTGDFDELNWQLDQIYHRLK